NTESCTIFAINAETGKHLWSYWLRDPFTRAPTIPKGRVFASYPQMATDNPKQPVPPGANHALAAFDLKTGKVQWQLWLGKDVVVGAGAPREVVYLPPLTGTRL